MTGTSFVHEKRGSMTPQRRARIFQAAEGRCYRCKRKIGPSDDWDCEHVVALENGGTDDDDNIKPCCEWCHAPKTADDHALAGHGRRMATKHVVPKRFKQKRGWR